METIQHLRREIKGGGCLTIIKNILYKVEGKGPKIESHMVLLPANRNDFTSSFPVCMPLILILA